ncbi:hypothetical protein G5I_02817 [Acromyrmex echinatior]|uniref:Uncharacterized protein n=1 Tax=Acromyrmex echinatior TaxID=103372 RepID=F4WBA9_ACREC|nr:hypothetical protein G5I_02817 [Acromyrmex echinatior]
MSNEIQRGIPDLHQQIYKTVTEEMLKTNEIQRGVIDMRQRINNTVTKETLEKSLKTTGRDTIVHALQDMQKDMSNDLKKVRDNVEEVLKGVNALSTRVSDEIHRGVTDLHQRMNNIVTKETLEKNAILAFQKVSDESQRLNRNVTDLRQQANDTKDTLTSNRTSSYCTHSRKKISIDCNWLQILKHWYQCHTPFSRNYHFGRLSRKLALTQTQREKSGKRKTEMGVESYDI